MAAVSFMEGHLLALTLNVLCLCEIVSTVSTPL
jgi:hypothetical protein